MRHLEFIEGKALHQYLELKGIRHFHVPNETPSKTRAIFNKMLGVQRGVSDYFIFLPNKKELVIELKSKDPKAKATKEQLEWLEFFASIGKVCAVCHGFEEARQFIELEL